MHFFSRCLGFIAILAMLGGSAAVASPQGKRIAVLATPTTNAWSGAWHATLDQVAAAEGLKLTNFTSPFDAALQSQQVDDAIAQKFDMIVIIVINPQAIVPALTRAKAAGVPVIVAVGPLEKENSDLYVSNVGTDQTRLGMLAGESLVKGLAAEGKTQAQVAAVTGTASQLQAQLRMAGFRGVLAKHPGIKLVGEEDGKWNTALSETVTSQLLVRNSGHGGLDAIYAMADNQATGAIRAIRAAGIPVGVGPKGIVVVSSNCTKDGIAQIRDGSQYSTNTQIPTLEAKLLAESIANFFNGRKLKQEEFVQTYAITQANVDQYAALCNY